MNYDKTNNMTTYVNVVQNVELFIKPHWLGICTCASQANKQPFLVLSSLTNILVCLAWFATLFGTCNSCLIYVEEVLYRKMLPGSQKFNFGWINFWQWYIFVLLYSIILLNHHIIKKWLIYSRFANNPFQFIWDHTIKQLFSSRNMKVFFCNTLLSLVGLKCKECESFSFLS